MLDLSEKLTQPAPSRMLLSLKKYVLEALYLDHSFFKAKQNN